MCCRYMPVFVGTAVFSSVDGDSGRMLVGSVRPAVAVWPAVTFASAGSALLNANGVSAVSVGVPVTYRKLNWLMTPVTAVTLSLIAYRPSRYSVCAEPVLLRRTIWYLLVAGTMAGASTRNVGKPSK